MFLALVSVVTAEQHNSVTTYFECTNRVRKLWKSTSLLAVSTLISKDEAAFSERGDESVFPVTFEFDHDEECSLCLLFHPEHCWIVSKEFILDNTSRSASTSPHPGVMVRIFVQEKWDYDPFTDLPPELMHLIFSSMIERDDLDISVRGNSNLPRYLQQIRLTNRFFAKTALSTLGCTLGTVYSSRNMPGLLGGQRDSGPRLSPLTFVRHYPAAFAPYLRQLFIGDRRDDPTDIIWSLLIQAFHLCKNLGWVVLFVRPPSNRTIRKIALTYLLSLPLLSHLQISNKVGHGASRWDANDLSLLLSRGLRVRDFSMLGWDLRVETNFSAAKTAVNLQFLTIRECLMTTSSLQLFLPFLLPQISPKVEEPIFYFIFEGFRHDSLQPEQLFQLMAELRPHLRHFTCQLGPWQGELALTLLAAVDDDILSLTGLRELVIDGNHEVSNLISDQFLYRVSQLPNLMELELLWCYVVPASIPTFILHHTKSTHVPSIHRDLSFSPIFGDPDSTKRSLCISTLFGDLSWTVDQFTEQLRIVDYNSNAFFVDLTRPGQDRTYGFKGSYFEVGWKDGADQLDNQRSRW
ncbi:hypothetical protein BT69DRAFT_1352939 [Atractiella rhizophila]|nr:hypothetical protein BT69DRAFT_1352939 [Atractiella rhizophila]